VPPKDSTRERRPRAAPERSPRPRRPALGALFILLAVAFAGVAYAAAVAGEAAWIVAGAAALMAVWMAEQAFKALR
jgi:hypothetical protein